MIRTKSENIERAGDGGRSPSLPPRDDREQRLARALRTNLRRRKAQSRARAADADTGGDDGEGGAVPGAEE